MSSFAVHWGHVGMFGVKACSLPRRRTIPPVTQGHAGYITEHLWVRSVARDFVILYVDVSLRQALIESFLVQSPYLSRSSFSPFTQSITCMLMSLKPLCPSVRRGSFHPPLPSQEVIQQLQLQLNHQGDHRD